MLVRYMLSSCVCPFVCHKSEFYKVAKPSITQTMPYDSPGILVFWCQKSQLNSDGITPNGGAK